MSFSLRSRLVDDSPKENSSSHTDNKGSFNADAGRDIPVSNSTVLIPEDDKWTNKRDYDLLDSINLTTRITGAMTAEQYMVYSVAYRIHEITQQLKFPEKFAINPPPSEKPLPPPVYDATGKRVNTPKYLYIKSLEQERHQLIEFISSMVSDYISPADYKKPSNKLVEKIFIPTNEYPDINFIGLLIGPRANTLRKLQEDSGARIAIRGKGSVKEGKNRSTITEKQNNLEEDLHVLVIADDPKKVKKGVQLVNDIINKAVLTPEGQNDLKRGQLRELALINGTLREYDQKPCPNCGELGHNRYNCTKAPKTSSVICRICGLNGHFARDCKFRNQNNSNNSGATSTDVDREFEIMMNEINGNEPSYGAQPGTATAIMASTDGNSQTSSGQPSLPAIPSQIDGMVGSIQVDSYSQNNRGNTYFQQSQDKQVHNNKNNYGQTYNYQNQQHAAGRNFNNNMNRSDMRHSSASPPPQNNGNYYRNQNNFNNNHNSNFPRGRNYNQSGFNRYDNSDYNNNHNNSDNRYNSSNDRRNNSSNSYDVISQQQPTNPLPPPPPPPPSIIDMTSGDQMIPPPPPPPDIGEMVPPPPLVNLDNLPPPPPPSDISDIPPPPGV